MVFSDEAYFYLTLPVNIQNNRQWSKGQPFLDVERPLHDKKILVWCGISVNRVFGPYYFENTINQKNYLEMLKNFFWPRKSYYGLLNTKNTSFNRMVLVLIQLRQFKLG